MAKQWEVWWYVAAVSAFSHVSAALRATEQGTSDDNASAPSDSPKTPHHADFSGVESNSTDALLDDRRSQEMGGGDIGEKKAISVFAV